MVTLIDEDGRLFGLVNVLDLLVVLIVVAMAAAGWALVSGGGPGSEGAGTAEAQNTTTVTFEAQQVEPYVAAAIPNGTVDGREVVAVHSKTVEPASVVVPDQNGQLHVREHPRLKTVTLRLELNTTSKGGRLLFNNEVQSGNGPVIRERPLRIGHQLRIDVEDVSVQGNVTAIDG